MLSRSRLLSSRNVQLGHKTVIFSLHGYSVTIEAVTVLSGSSFPKVIRLLALYSFNIAARIGEPGFLFSTFGSIFCVSFAPQQIFSYTERREETPGNGGWESFLSADPIERTDKNFDRRRH